MSGDMTGACFLLPALAPAPMHAYIPSALRGRFSRVDGIVGRHSSSRFDMRTAIVRSGASAMAIAFPNGASLINTQHKSQTQVRSTIAPLEFGGPFTLQIPETPTDVTSSPSTTRNFSLLLDLPVEIQIEIIKILQYSRHARLVGEQHTHPLKSLRLTCKQIEALCNPVFAEFISVSAIDQPALELRKELASKFAKYLKTMACFFSRRQGEEGLFMMLVLTTILERAVRLRQISLFHGSSDSRGHSQLLSAISKLSALEDVKIWQVEYPQYPPPYLSVQSTFHHRLLNHILDYHSQRLRELVVCSGTPMHESTFLKLCDSANQLRRLGLSRCLTIETREAFAEPQRWACAGRLESLYIRQCTIPIATITRHIGAGVFGPLRTFHIDGCRGHSGDPPEAGAITWTIPALVRVSVDQVNDWEMDRLRGIHAKSVYLRRAWGSRPLCIEAFRRSTTFPEVAELHVEKDWDDKDFEELKRSCAMRGLTKVERDLPPHLLED